MMSSSSSICDKISIKTTFRADGMLGDNYEYNPYALTWTSFNPYRVERLCNYALAKDQPTHIEAQHVDTKRRIQSKYAAHASIRNATKSDKLRAFRSMVSFGADGNEKEEAVPQKVIIDTPINSSIYESTNTIHVDQLGDYSEMRGDAAIWFKLMSHTRYSGIDQIDKNDFQFAERTIPDGVTSIELYTLFSQYVKECHGKGTNTCTFKSVFIDPKVTGIFLQEQRQKMKGKHVNDSDLIEKAYEATFKALVHFEVTIEGFNFENYSKSIFGFQNLKESHLHAYLPMKSSHGGGKTLGTQSHHPLNAHSSSSSSSSSNNKVMGSKSMNVLPSSVEFAPRLYNSKKSMETMMGHLEQLVQVYCNSFVTIEDKVSKFKPLNKNVSNLQLLILNSEQGQVPVVSYGTNHCPYTREYASEELRQKELKLYGYNANTERYFKMIANSSLRRHGMNKEKFIEVVDSHFSIGNKSPTSDSLFIACQKIATSLGTFAANSAYYTSDYRYIPVFDIKGSSYHKNHVERKGIDSFDNELLNFGSNSDDCEGQAFTAAAIIQAFSYGRYDLDYHQLKGKTGRYDYSTLREKANLRFGDWDSRLLQRIQLVLNNTHIACVGSTVTSAYVDNDNKTINIKDMDLPMINDQIDLKSHCDGHCFNIVFSSYTIATMLENGKNDKSIVQSIKPFYLDAQMNVIHGDSFHERDKSLATLVSEGTGPIEPTVLAVNEAYKGNEVERRRAATEKLFLKSLKTRLIDLGHGEDINVNNEKTKDRDAIMNKFQAKGPPFYIDEQPENRRVSSFYREVVHGVFATLYTRHDVTLSQAAFCKKDKYGVNMGDLLRASKSPNANGISLISPYRNAKKQWIEETLPLKETVENHTPIMQYGRYSKEQYESQIYSHYIDPASLALNDWHFPTSVAEFKKMKMAGKSSDRETQMARFHNVHANKNEVVIDLYSRVWKLNQSRDDMAKFQAFIEGCPGLKHYGYFIEKHLPNCDPLVEILCIVDMNEFEKHNK